MVPVIGLYHKLIANLLHQEMATKILPLAPMAAQVGCKMQTRSVVLRQGCPQGQKQEVQQMRKREENCLLHWRFPSHSLDL